MKKYIGILSFTLISLLASPSFSQEAKEETKTEPTKEVVKVYDLEAPAALIGDKTVSVGDVKKYYDENPALHAYAFETLYKGIVDDIVKKALMKEAALKAKIAELPDVKQIIEEQVDSIVATFYLVKEIEKEKTEKALKKIYKDVFDKDEEEVKVKHILVKTEKEAEDILKRLKKGEEFEKLAKELSLDQSAEDGGDIGYISKDSLPPKGYEDFTKVALKTKKGTLAKNPVKSASGYHVIKVEDKRKIPVPSYDDPRVKNEVERYFATEKSKEILEKLTKDAKVKTYDLKEKK